MFIDRHVAMPTSDRHLSRAGPSRTCSTTSSTSRPRASGSSWRLDGRGIRSAGCSWPPGSRSACPRSAPRTRSTRWWPTPARCRRAGRPRGCPTGSGLIPLGVLCFLFLLFPTGQLRSPRWRPAAWFVAGAFTLVTAFFLVFSTMSWNDPYGRPRPAAHRASRWCCSFPCSIVSALVVSLAAVIVRFRGSVGEERLQLKWFATGAACRRGRAHPHVRLERPGLAGAPEPGVRRPLHRDRRRGPEVPPLRDRRRHQQDGRLRDRSPRSSPPSTSRSWWGWAPRSGRRTTRS